MLALHAHDAGRQAAADVLAGTLTAEAAGDRWLTYADASYGAGLAFQRAYDAAGAPR